jgi:hypothetical protein
VLGHEGGEPPVGVAVYLKRIGVENLKTVVGAVCDPDDIVGAVLAIVKGLKKACTSRSFAN